MLRPQSVRWGLGGGIYVGFSESLKVSLITVCTIEMSRLVSEMFPIELDQPETIRSTHCHLLAPSTHIMKQTMKRRKRMTRMTTSRVIRRLILWRAKLICRELLGRMSSVDIVVEVRQVWSVGAD